MPRSRKVRIAQPVNGSFAFHFGDDGVYIQDEDVEQDEKFFVPHLNLSSFKVTPEQIANKAAREIMMSHILIEQKRLRKGFIHPQGSYLRCPEGGDYLPSKYIKRRQVGPYLNCPVPHAHGAMYRRFRMKAKVGRTETPTFRRPFYLKTKKRTGPIWRKANVPLELDCGHCARIAFEHHVDPMQHYWDYVAKQKGVYLVPKPFKELVEEVSAMWGKKSDKKKRKKFKGKRPGSAAASYGAGDFVNVKPKVDTKMPVSFRKAKKKAENANSRKAKSAQTTVSI